MLHTQTVNFSRTILCLSSWNCASYADCSSEQAWWITAVSLSIGPYMAVSIFYSQYSCPVRSWPFPDTGRFLAGLFTFLSRRTFVNRLRASGRNWFRTIIMTMEICIVFREIMLSCETWSVVHVNKWQEISNTNRNCQRGAYFVLKTWLSACLQPLKRIHQ